MSTRNRKWGTYVLTDNERLRRKIRMTAINKAYTTLRRNHNAEWQAILANLMETEDSTRAILARKADRTIRDLHRMEYDIALMTLNASLQREAGYVSQAHKGWRNLNNAKVDGDAVLHEDAS